MITGNFESKTLALALALLYRLYINAVGDSPTHVTLPEVMLYSINRSTYRCVRVPDLLHAYPRVNDEASG